MMSLPPLTEGQTIENVRAGVREGFTLPPKPYTEDTLLSAMENAGDFSETPDSRKGLGTPATRAAIIEKLIKSGFVERRNAKKVKQLFPLEKGVNLITILPDVLKSPEMTANWEYMLKKVERKELSSDEFMAGIVEMTNELVKTNSAPNSE